MYVRSVGRIDVGKAVNVDLNMLDDVGVAIDVGEIEVADIEVDDFGADIIGGIDKSAEFCKISLVLLAI